MKHFDPAMHRSPDLWIEVDLLSTSVPREPICARLGVPEIWRYSEGRLTVRLLGANRTYFGSPASKVFPFLPMDGFASFIPKMISDDETQVLSEFQQWARKLPALTSRNQRNPHTDQNDANPSSRRYALFEHQPGGYYHQRGIESLEREYMTQFLLLQQSEPEKKPERQAGDAADEGKTASLRSGAGSWRA